MKNGDLFFYQEEDLILANLGDSRAVLGTITESGIRAVQLTSDLKPSVLSKKLVSYDLFCSYQKFI